MNNEESNYENGSEVENKGNNVDSVLRMCDKCLHVMSENEIMYGFILVDSDGYEKPFKGHEDCVMKLRDEIRAIYGKED